eukprot:1818626-Rhodomonas_salina.3
MEHSHTYGVEAESTDIKLKCHHHVLSASIRPDVVTRWMQLSSSPGLSVKAGRSGSQRRCMYSQAEGGASSEGDPEEHRGESVRRSSDLVHSKLRDLFNKAGCQCVSTRMQLEI